MNKTFVQCNQMVQEYLENNGYDGLVDDDGECACSLDDLMPCGGDFTMSCIAGHKVDGCSDHCGIGCDFHIIPGRRPKTQNEHSVKTEE